jgi:hypothetical protein
MSATLIRQRSTRRIVRRLAFSVCYGGVATVLIAIGCANVREWHQEAEREIWSGAIDGGEACRSADGSGLFHVREISRKGLKISLIRELPLREVKTGAAESVTVLADSGEMTLPLVDSSLPARFDPRGFQESNSVNVYSYGWPCAAMGYREYSSNTGCFYSDFGTTNWLRIAPRISSSPNAQAGTAFPPSPDDSWGVPTAIDPSGFAINTVAFSFTWFASASLAAVVRDYRARNRNICKHCNYSCDGIAAENVCPECGRAPHA